MKRKHGLLAGLTLILLANAIALGGVWYNRSGDPDSRLVLSERELPLPDHWQRKENSGVALRLNWRMPSDGDSRSRYLYRHLSEEQMLQLGYSRPVTDNGKRLEPREVLVVLELDGPAYKEELRRAQADLEHARKAQRAQPRDKELEQRLKAARTGFDQERNEASRLFAIDVGLDPAVLRQRYPDRRRYAIVRGQVRPWYNHEDGQLKLSGSLRELSIQHINMPWQWRRQFAEAIDDRYGPDRGKRAAYQVELSFGRRLEPWVSAVPRFAK
jgi:hypothetical protein